MEPRITARPDHCVSRKQISSAALKVLYRLKETGHTAYLAGGGVRDLLLKRAPKDFDVATDATPDDVRKIFRNCRLIGRRFRLAHVYFRDETIEVSTFRALTPSGGEAGEHAVDENGQVLRDNVFGTPEEDALRRDFTVNALFYNIADFSIIDYAGGMADLEKKVLRVIGDPETRFTEDPVRILRAVRFAASLGFRIEPGARDAVRRHADKLEGCSSSRLYEEIRKLFGGGCTEKVFTLCSELGIWEHLFPELGAWLHAADDNRAVRWLEKSCRQIDRWHQAGFPVDPALLFALLFGDYHEWAADRIMEQEQLSHAEALQEAVRRHLRELDRIRIPKAVTQHIASIMRMQPRFLKTNAKTARRTLHHRDFLDAFLYFKFSACTAGRHAGELAWWDEQRKKK